MPVGFILFLVWMALEVVVVAASIAWGFENGQWKNIEEAKYNMLVDHELQPWPGREKPSTTTEQGKEAAK
jgi:nitrogen fixation-related uncharacterized protein